MHKRINGQIDFVQDGIFSMEVKELKTELNCSEKSPLFIERIKIRAHGGYSAPFVYLPERGRAPFPFSFSSPVSQLSSPLPSSARRTSSMFSVFSGEAATSNQRNAPADTPPPISLAHTDAHATIVGACTLTNTDLVTGTANGQGTYPRAKGPDNTREPRSNADAMAISSRATK